MNITPGPWEAEVISEGEVWIVPANGDRPGNVIAECECLKNARLIAAAPELLGACHRSRDAFSAIRDGQNPPGGLCGLLDGIRQLIQILDVAVAKAEGKPDE